MTTDEFLIALGYAETNNDWVRVIGGRTYEVMGDGGQAFGRWQVHPVWVWWAANKFIIQPMMHEQWDSFVERCIRAFFEWAILKLTPIEIAMRYHRGHTELANDPDWDHEYERRFRVAVT